VLVADSYNHKIKVVEPGSRTSATLLGDGRPGAEDGAGNPRLFEPGGLTVAGDELLVADTNNHRVVWADLAGGAWREVAIEGLEPPARRAGGPGPAGAEASGLEVPPVTLRRAGGVTLAVDAALEPGFHPNPEAPLTLRLRANGRVLVQVTRTVAALPAEFALPAGAIESGTWHVDLSFVGCTEGEAARCVPVRRSWRVAVALSDDGADRLELRAPPAAAGG
jgi:hypothetical protein